MAPTTPSPPRLFLLPAEAGLESACVRLGPRGPGFRFSPRSAWLTFQLGGRRFSWVRDVAILGRGQAVAASGDGGEDGPDPGGGSAPEEGELFLVDLDAPAFRRHSAAAVAGAARKLDSMLRFWRDMPPLPTPEELERAAEARPFEFQEAEPEPSLPDLAEERLALEQEIRGEVLRARRVPPSRTALLVGLGLAFAASAAVGRLLGGRWTGAALGAAAGVAAASAALGALRLGLRALGEAEVRRRLGAEWAAREERSAAARRHDWGRWDLHRAQARAAWSGAEAERVDRVKRLLAGDLEAVRACLEATLADLDFPYPAACEVATDGETAFLLLDLPGVDAVIPPVKAEVDGELQVTEVEVDPAERDEAYGDHVAGVALLLARAAFASAPRLRKVKLAGYRQGPRAGAAKVEYLVEALVGRESAEVLDPAVVDPARFLEALPGAAPRTRGGLAPLPAPPWLSEGPGAYALPSPKAAYKN